MPPSRPPPGCSAPSLSAFWRTTASSRRPVGPGEALRHARDQHELYFRDHPTETDREYLLHVFHAVGQRPGGQEIFGPHNPVFELPQWLSGDAAGDILAFFQRIDADTGELHHDFTDPDWDTRFLGDLYQDLSEAARKKYALLQTPEFVEEFILDRTLDPALDEFGLDAPAVENRDGDPITAPGFRLIDPACGSGHFLLGTFRRLLDRWQRQEPGAKAPDLVQRTLHSVCGVDINPYAIAIARFRLLIAALQACGIGRLQDAPAFHFNLAAGDSLLHGAPGADQQLFGFDPLSHHYQSEDLDALRQLLRPGTYHAVVANPPYITPKDKLLNQAYRDRYRACHRQYALTIPFMERIFGLAIQGGFTGQITSNSFMKREFGKKLIESFFPTVDLTHVIDTSGAYLPGHGTPTVILHGRNRAPVASTLRTVLGIRGEPSTPQDPAKGLVWSAIVDQIDRPGSESDYVSSGDSDRSLFHSHPWSIGGGGASELKEHIELSSKSILGKCVSIGIGAITGEDNCLVYPVGATSGRLHLAVRELLIGEPIRDWSAIADQVVLWPNTPTGERKPEDEVQHHKRHLWAFRRTLKSRLLFSVPLEEKGIPWWALKEVYTDKLRTPLSIVFAFVATHNHFVLDRGGKVFKQSAPVIKLPEGATEEEHLALLGLLNSSTACFWMQQVFHNKGGPGGGSSKDEKWHDFFEHDGTKLKQFPLPAERPTALARVLDGLAQETSACTPAAVLAVWDGAADLGATLEMARAQSETLRSQLIALQEDLDWQSYRLYGLLDEDLTLEGTPPMKLGERAFEIVLAQKLAAGTVSTIWFERLGAKSITEIPVHWPEAYRALVQRRIDLINSDKNIRLVERPEHKRRWETESWDSQQERALRGWLLDRLERYFDFDGRMNDDGTPTAELAVELCSTAHLADIAQRDPAFHAAAALYTNDPAFDGARLVAELVASASVPHLPVLRYKPAGLRKREVWEQTWALQRQEDVLDACAALPEDHPNHLSRDEADKRKKASIGDIPVPPKYGSGDFLKSSYWKLRGKLDVPKERWLSFPHGEGQDGSLMIAWAGYDHLQLTQALSAHYVDVQQNIGGSDDPRLLPLLASLIELIPWLKQWHNDLDPEFNMAMGDYFEGFVQEEARDLGMTLEEVKGWEAPKKMKVARKKKKE